MKVRGPNDTCLRYTNSAFVGMPFCRKLACQRTAAFSWQLSRRKPLECEVLGAAERH